jgi:hypothetical protein
MAGGKKYIHSQCSACHAIQAIEWQKRNPERRRRNAREWVRKHKSYVAENKRKWRLKNPQKHCATEGRRRSALMLRLPVWADISAINEFYGNRPAGMEVDHIYPLRGKTVSGLHVLSNLQYLTRSENASKGNRV